MQRQPPPQQGTLPPLPRWLKQKQRCDGSMIHPLAYLFAPAPAMLIRLSCLAGPDLINAQKLTAF